MKAAPPPAPNKVPPPIKSVLDLDYTTSALQGVPIAGSVPTSMPAPGKAAATSSSGPGVSVPGIGFKVGSTKWFDNAKAGSGSAESLLSGGGPPPTKAPANDAGTTSVLPAIVSEMGVRYHKMSKRVFLPETYRQKAAYWRALVPPSIAVLCDATCRNKEFRFDLLKESVVDGRKLGQQRFDQVRFVEASLKTWSPESTLQKIRAKTSGGAAASSSAAKNLEPGAKRRKRVNSAAKEDDMIAIDTAIAEDATFEDGIAHPPDGNDLCFVPREILVKWFEGQDIVKLQKSNYCTDEDELKKVPEEYRKEWTDLLQKIQCRHKLVNPLAVWSNAVKVVPQRTVEDILSSVRFFEAGGDDSVLEVDSSPENPLRKGKGAVKKKQLLTKKEQEKEQEDREKFVRYVHKSCCRECTELLWDAYWNQMSQRFAARQVVDEVKTGSTPHELETLLWKNKQKNREVRENAGVEWNWFPKSSWNEHFKKPVDAMKRVAGQGAEGMGVQTPFGQLMNTIKGMRVFTGWGCSRKDDDGEVSSTRDEENVSSSYGNNYLGMSEQKFVDTLKTEIQCEAHVKCVHSRGMPKDVTNGGKKPVNVGRSTLGDGAKLPDIPFP